MHHPHTNAYTQNMRNCCVTYHLPFSLKRDVRIVSLPSFQLSASPSHTTTNSPLFHSIVLLMTFFAISWGSQFDMANCEQFSHSLNSPESRLWVAANIIVFMGCQLFHISHRYKCICNAAYFPLRHRQIRNAHTFEYTQCELNSLAHRHIIQR